MLTYEQRNKLIELLVEDMANSVASDSSFAYRFVEDVMKEGYKSIREYDDEQLLSWYYDSFERDFLEEYANGAK